MSTIAGHRGFINKRQWQAIGVHGVEPGWYIGDFTNPTACEIECPYCHRALLEVQAVDLLRIAQILDETDERAEIIAQRVPADLRVLMCPTPCLQTFTVPRD